MAERSISYTFKANFSQFRAQVAAAGAAVSDFGAKLEAEHDTAEGLREQLDLFADAAAKAGLAAGAGFTAAVVTAANFEQALSQVQAATGETAANMVTLKDAALDAGQATVFSANEAAAAIEELSKAGVSTADILDGGLSGALDLAAAGGLEVAAAAEAAASAMTQFGLSGEDVPHIADLLAAGAGKAQGSVEDMSMALNQSGLVAAQTGLTIEETTGALSAFASAGLTGSDAGTSFKTMLQALTPSSKEAKKLMDQLGISAYDAQGNFVGLANFADSLRNGLKSLTVEQQNAALKTIFGADAVRAAAVIYDQGAAGIQDWINKTNDAGYAAEQAAIRTDNLTGDIEQLKGAFETALIGTGEGQLGLLRDFTQGLTDLVNVYNSLPAAAKDVTGSFLGITALLAGGAFFTAKAILSVTAMKAELAALGTQGALTATSLKGLALAGLGLAVMIPVLGQLNKAILENQAALGSGDLERDFESALLGNSSEAIGDFIRQLDYLKSSGYGIKEYSNEIATLGGLLGDTGGDTFTKNIEAVDEALAGMVETGQVQKAEQLFKMLSEGYESTGGNIEDVVAVLPDYQQALDNAAASGTTATGATAGLGEAAEVTSPAVEELAEALKKAREKAFNAVDTFRDLTAGIKDGKFSFKEWITALEASAVAVRNFRKNADKALDRGLDEGLVAELQTMGTEGALQLEYLANASDAEIERTNKAIRKLERQTEKTVTQMTEDIAALDAVEANPEIEVQAPGFQAKLHAIDVALDRLTRPRTVDITAALNPFGSIEARMDRRGSADGSTVPKDGGTYRDRYPYLLAPGEEVISDRNGQATRNRPLLKAINAGVDPALALAQSRQAYSGGYSTSGGGAGIDYDRLAMAMLQARPLYGDVHMQPHNYSEFQRQQESDQRRASIGGFGQ